MGQLDPDMRGAENNDFWSLRCFQSGILNFRSGRGDTKFFAVLSTSPTTPAFYRAVIKLLIQEMKNYV